MRRDRPSLLVSMLQPTHSQHHRGNDYHDAEHHFDVLRLQDLPMQSSFSPPSAKDARDHVFETLAAAALSGPWYREWFPTRYNVQGQCRRAYSASEATNVRVDRHRHQTLGSYRPNHLPRLALSYQLCVFPRLHGQDTSVFQRAELSSKSVHSRLNQ